MCRNSLCTSKIDYPDQLFLRKQLLTFHSEDFHAAFHTISLMLLLEGNGEPSDLSTFSELERAIQRSMAIFTLNPHVKPKEE